MTSMMTMMAPTARAAARMTASGRFTRRIGGFLPLPDPRRRGDVGGQIGHDDVDLIDLQPGQFRDPVADVAADLIGDLENGGRPADTDFQADERFGAIDLDRGFGQRIQVSAAYAQMPGAGDGAAEHAGPRRAGVGVL